MRFGYQRAHFEPGLIPRADAQRGDARLKTGHKLIGYVRPYRHRDENGHATFPGRAEGRTDQGVNGLVEVGIRPDHQVILRAAERLDATSEKCHKWGSLICGIRAMGAMPPLR